jgi:hypothetical protein
VKRILQLARHAIKRELASEAQLILVRLHAQQKPPFTACDLAAEAADIVAAAALHGLDRAGNTISDVGLRQRAR